MNEIGDKVPEEEKAPVKAEIEKVKEALKGTDTEAIKAATESLQQAFYKVSEKLYQQANPQGANPQDFAGGAQDAAGAQGGADNVYEADYREVDDNK